MNNDFNELINNEVPVVALWNSKEPTLYPYFTGPAPDNSISILNNLYFIRFNQPSDKHFLFTLHPA